MSDKTCINCKNCIACISGITAYCGLAHKEAILSFANVCSKYESKGVKP